MSERTILAQHYRTGQPVRLVLDAGRVASLTPVKEEGKALPWLAPGLVDLQVNGYAGVDFQQDELTIADLRRAVLALQQDGCTQFFFTLITESWAKLIKRLRHVRKLRDMDPTLRAAIAGWHIEGPFLSAEPGFCGAHEPSLMCDPTPAHIDELRQAAGNDPVLLTLAPERSGALEAIRHAVRLGMRVSLGHTNASAEQLEQAHAAGATGFTHLGNGCPAQLDRRDNILWRVLDAAKLTVSLIPDTFHVSAPLFRLIHKLLPDQQIYYTTDAMSAAGAPPGRYTLGRLELDVGPDGMVRLPGTANLAGSALRPIDGVWRAARMLRTSWQSAWARLSDHCASFAGLPSGLTVGQRAQFCLIASDQQQRPQRVQVWRGDEVVAERTIQAEPVESPR